MDFGGPKFEGQCHNALITENGLYRLTAFPLHISSSNFKQKAFHESRMDMCPLGFGVRRYKTNVTIN